MKLKNLIEIEGLEGPSDTPKDMGRRGFGLPGNAGREFGEKFMKDLIGSGKLAELWTAFEATYPELQSELQTTFKKTNDLLGYIKPEMGDETYKVSSMPEAAAQELDNLLHDVLETLEFVSSQNKEPSIEMVKSVIKDFDNTFSDMLAIFTSNTDSDKPLEPYKQTDIGFGINENEEDKAADLWNKYKGKIFADINVERRTRRNIQTAVLTDPKYAIKWIEDWAEENHFTSKEEAPPFEEQYHYHTMTLKKQSQGNTRKGMDQETFYEIDALHEDEAYCPKCANKLRESVKKLVAECWKTHKQVGTKKKGDKTVPNCVPKNEEVGDYTAKDQWDDFDRWEKVDVLDLLGYDGNIILHNSIGYEEVLDDVLKGDKETFDAAILGTDPPISEKTKPAKGKRFAKKVKNKKTGRTRTVSYGQAGKAKKGGDRIRPGTAKGNAYCARSAKIKKCKNPPCANTLSRKKWKCQGSRSVK